MTILLKTEIRAVREYFEKSVSNSGSLGMMGMDFEVIDEKRR